MIGLLWLVLSADGWTDPPPHVQQIWDRSFAKQSSDLRLLLPDLEAATRELAAAKEAKVPKSQRKAAWAETARLEKRVAQLRASIQETMAEPFIMRPLDAFELSVGQVGVLDYGHYVVNVHPSTFKVEQVLGPEEMLIRTGKKLTMVRGCKTDGLVTDGWVKLDGVMRVSGTETYESTAGGTNTVFVVEPSDTNEFERWLPQLQKTVWRTWTDASGKFSIEAKAVGFRADVVTLRKLDGSEIELPLSKLSTDDQRFLNAGIAEQGANHEAKNR